MKSLILELFSLIFINFISSAPQMHPEINDQFENVTSTTVKYTDSTTTSTKAQTYEESDENNEIFDDQLDTSLNTTTSIVEVKPSIISKIYKIIKIPLSRLIETPKVNTVLKNIGTCVVNGVMEIVSYYFPAPFIPLIASAAGMVIPFEPVVMLRRRMPVTSYRRAIKTAVNGFMNTFDAYKFDNSDEDPYMTRRFNRRFMNDVANDEVTKSDVTQNNIEKKSIEDN